jgi:hypothetical protein
MRTHSNNSDKQNDTKKNPSLSTYPCSSARFADRSALRHSLKALHSPPHIVGGCPLRLRHAHGRASCSCCGTDCALELGKRKPCWGGRARDWRYCCQNRSRGCRPALRRSRCSLGRWCGLNASISENDSRKKCARTRTGNRTDIKPVIASGTRTGVVLRAAGDGLRREAARCAIRCQRKHSGGDDARRTESVARLNGAGVVGPRFHPSPANHNA